MLAACALYMLPGIVMGELFAVWAKRQTEPLNSDVRFYYAVAVVLWPICIVAAVAKAFR